MAIGIERVATVVEGGGGGSGTFYVHEQAVASDEWEVVHNLGYRPGGVTVEDSAGTEVEGEIEFVNTNELVVRFSAPFTGKVYLS